MQKSLLFHDKIFMKAYGYCRYLSDLQNKASIEQQKNELKEYALKNNNLFLL
jgi:DNA invertase Pin-like site-specific DNA recombinase